MEERDHSLDFEEMILDEDDDSIDELSAGEFNGWDGASDDETTETVSQIMNS